jgi:YD repeat-containing protein
MRTASFVPVLLLATSAAFAQAPVPLDCGVVVDGSFTTGPTNFYNFNPLAGDSITVRLLATSADLGSATQIVVKDQNGRTLTRRANGITAGATLAADFDIQTTGPYQIQIQNSRQTGSYKLVYTYLNRPCTGTTLTCGGALHEQIAGPLQVKSYQFPVNAGDVLTVRWLRQAPFTMAPPIPPSTTPGPAFTPAFAIFSPGGQLELATNGQGAAGSAVSGRIDAAQSAAGSVTILVFDGNNQNGNYSFVAAVLNRPCSGGKLDCASVTQGSVAAPLGITSYGVDLRAGDVGAVRVAAVASPAFAPASELYDPQGKLVSTQAASNVRFAATSDGTYTVLVHDIHDGVNGTGTGSYAAALVRFNRPCGQTAQLACSSAVDGAVNGVLATTSYSLAASAGDVYLLRLLRTDQSGNFRPRIDVYDAQANAVTSVIATDLARQTITFPANGNYTLVASDGFDGTQSGAFMLSVLRLNRPCNAGTLSCGAPASGSFSRSLGTGAYTYAAAAGESFSVRLLDPSGSLQPGLEVYDPQGAPVGQNLSGNFIGVDLAQPVAGSYTILALDNSRRPGAGGPFVLDLLRTSNPCGASPAQGQTTGGVVSGAVPFASYRIPASAGDSLLVRSASSTPGFAAQMEMYDPNGARLDTQTFGLSRKAAVSGSYTVIVGPSAPRTVGGYSLAWQLLNNPAGASALACGGTTGGSLAGAGQFRYYSTAAAAGDVLRLLFTKLTDNFSPQVEVYDPTGARVASSLDITYKVPADGNYLVLVSPTSSSGESGSYALSFQRPNNPCTPMSLTCGQTALRQVAQPGQVDTFTFNGTGSDRANLKLGQRSGGYTPFAELYDAAGTRLGTSSSGSLLSTLAATGSYSLLVRDTRGTTVGSYRVTLQDDTNACPVKDTEAPSVALVQPTGGEVIGGGSAYFIQWQSDDNVGVATHDVALSTDGGKTFATAIASGLGGNVQSFAWQVPADIAPSRTAVLRVTATDGAGNVRAAVSAPLAVIGAGFPVNNTATYSYDPLNRLTQAVLGNGRSITYSYDADGNLVSISIGQ